MTPTTFKLGELFCGPGGLACGALAAKVLREDTSELFTIEHAWANDYHEDTCRTYSSNICQVKDHISPSVFCGDVRKLDFEKLKKTDSNFASINALAFGFPCNDFSMVGKQKGFEGTYGPLYSYGIKVLKLMQPYWFLAENVGGLKSANQGEAFKAILRSMIDAGYNIRCHLYKFEEYGIPQARHRYIIVGIRKDQPYVFNVPARTTPNPENYVNCERALSNMPEDLPNNEQPRMHPRVVERLKCIPEGGNAFTADLPEELRLHVKGATISQIYKRLDRSKPAYTVTGSGGGGTHMYHWEEPRSLTNREKARLQTFPDDHIFCGSRVSVRRQVGMAVPCEGARIIFEAILKTFARVKYDIDENQKDIEYYLGKTREQLSLL